MTYSQIKLRGVKKHVALAYTPRTKKINCNQLLIISYIETHHFWSLKLGGFLTFALSHQYI